MSQDFNIKIRNATKWSAITELAAKLVTPVSSMVLARLLTPEVFGIVATLTMIISFAEIFTDAGFQKYIVQHEFTNDNCLLESTNVAFWSNLIMSITIWICIAFFCEPLASLVGNPGLGYVIAIACISIPLEAFSSIQMALYKRDFDFKTLFKVRVVVILIPLVITIPLAFIFRDFWALILGTIAKDIVNALLLTYYSRWKPSFYYSFSRLSEMLSFSLWSMVEQLTIWLNSYVDVFIVGLFLSAYYLGIYRTGCTTVTQIMGVVTAANTPVIFSTLSRLQNKRTEFVEYFLKFQKMVGLLVIPIGMIFYYYSDLLVAILLGSQWGDACVLVSLWGITEAFKILFSNFCSEAFRALGRPKLSVVSQLIIIVFVIPVVYYSAKTGYTDLCVNRSLMKIVQIVIQCTILFLLTKLNPLKMFKNLIPEIIGCAMFVLIFNVSNLFGHSIVISIVSIFISFILYILYLTIYNEEKYLLLKIFNNNILQVKLTKK